MKKISIYVIVLLAIILVGCKSNICTKNVTSQLEKKHVCTKNVTLQLEKKHVSIYTTPFQLRGGLPEGGCYSGEGVYEGKFYPSKAKYSGNYEITYTIDNISAKDYITLKGVSKSKIDPNCVECNGTGYIACEKNITCSQCGGEKKIVESTCRECNGTGKKRSFSTLGFKATCSCCKGTGLIYKTCPTCEGLGWLKCPKCRWTGKIKCSKCNK